VSDRISEWDEPLPTLDGRAWAFGFELTASVILGGEHADLAPARACRHLFASIDPTLADRLAVDDIIVAEEMVGTSEYVRPALAALAAAGVTALIARRFSAAFVATGRTHALPTLVLDAPSFIHTDDRLRLDLDAAKVVNLSSGDRAAIRNLDDAERAAWRVALADRLPRR
jgi:3-isopropylmalate/(R)-2-methylmalate dehydratase small subunit